MQITDDLTITGLGADQLTISGNHASGIFVVDDADPATTITVEISGLSLVNGNSSASGGGIYNTEDLTVEACTLSGNSTAFNSSNGGGIYNSGTLTVTNSTLANNAAVPTAGVSSTLAR